MKCESVLSDEKEDKNQICQSGIIVQYMALISAKVPRDIVSTLNVPLKMPEFLTEI